MYSKYTDTFDMVKYRSNKTDLFKYFGGNNEHTEKETHEQCKKSSKDIIIPFSGTDGCTRVVPGFSSGCFITSGT